MKKTTVKEVKELLKNLEEGTTLITYAKKVAQDTEHPKLSLEFAEIIPGQSGINLVAMFNEGDNRINSEVKPTRAWFPVEEAMAKKLLGIDVSEMSTEKLELNTGEVVEVYPIAMLNPIVQGRRLRVQINEYLGLKAGWESENPEKAIKQTGDGGFLFSKGQPIVRRNSVEAGTAAHSFISHDTISYNLTEQLYATDVEEVEEFEDVVS